MRFMNFVKENRKNKLDQKKIEQNFIRYEITKIATRNFLIPFRFRLLKIRLSQQLHLCVDL